MNCARSDLSHPRHVMKEKLQSSAQHGLSRNLTKVLPLPFGRGEGRGEGFRSVVHPTLPSVFSGLMVLALSLAPAALAQPSQVWENWGIINFPSQSPHIDTLTFINTSGAPFNFN